MKEIVQGSLRRLSVKFMRDNVVLIQGYDES